MPESLCLGKFHSHIRDVFAPQVVRYIDLMESSVAQSVHNGFEKETWQPQGCVNPYSRLLYTPAGWLGSRVVSVLDSGAEGPGFKSQPRRCRVTVLGKLFAPIVPLFTKQRNS